jgi:mannose/fructose/N-acetylgalactosamine-specific phosphotransferase system component IIC
MYYKTDLEFMVKKNYFYYLTTRFTCIILYLISQFGDSRIGVNLSLTYFLLETGDEKEDLQFGL